MTTAWWLPDYCLTTAWWLPDNCLMTAWQLPETMMTLVPEARQNDNARIHTKNTGYLLPDDCPMTAWWLPDDFLQVGFLYDGTLGWTCFVDLQWWKIYRSRTGPKWPMAFHLQHIFHYWRSTKQVHPKVPWYKKATFNGFIVTYQVIINSDNANLLELS